MTNRRLEQKEIDLVFFFYRILEQWRALLLAGLLFAALFSVGAHIKNIESVGNAVKQDESIEVSNSIKNTVRLYFAYYNSRETYADKAMEASSEEQALGADALATAYQNYSDSRATLSTEERETADAIINSAKRNNQNYYDKTDIDSCVTTYYNGREPEAVSVPKYGVYGFAVGICIYVLVIFFLLVFCKVFVCENEIDSVMQTRNFGSIYAYPYKTCLRRFAHSRGVYNHFHRGVENEKIAIDLGQKLLHEKYKKVVLLTLGSSDEQYQRILQTQSEILAEQGIDVDIVTVQEYASEIDDSEYSKMEAVFVQVISHTTTFELALELLDKIDEYSINLIGTEFVEI